MSMDISMSAGGAGSTALNLLAPVVKPSVFQMLWSIVKGLFSAKPVEPMLTAQQVENRTKNLKIEAFAAMKSACKAIPAQSKREFADRAAKMVNDVLIDCMLSVQKERANSREELTREATFNKAAAKARVFVQRHQEVAQAMDLAKLPAPVIKTVLVENPAGAHLPKVKRIVVLRAAPPIENLVLRGGGAKGIGNPPALRVLENLSTLSGLKKVVGTSAGALTAVCLASGMSAQEFQKLSNDTGMLSLLSSASDFKQRYPEVQLGTIGFGAGKALETLDRSSATSVSSYLKAHWDDIMNAPHWNSLGAADHQRLLSLRDQDLEKSPRTGQMITFHDLHLLHQLVPSKFKDLVLTGYNTTTKETTYFSAATHPDMPVALAGRISMSIPAFFKAVKLDVNGKTETFVDGGVGSNMPSEAVLDGLDGKARVEALSKTLLMTFDEDGSAYSLLHGSPAERKKAGEGLFSRFTNDRLDAEKIHLAGSNVLPIFHGKLGAFSFKASAEQIEQAQTQAMLKTLEHIENVMGGLRHDTVADPVAAARLMSGEEQNQFLKKYAGEADSMNAAVCRAIRELPERRAQQTGDEKPDFEKAMFQRTETMGNS